LSGFTDLRDFQRAHRQWVEQALENGCAPRDDRWSEAIAVGSLPFVERVKNDLGIKAMHREVLETNGTYALHEPSEAYARNLTGENEALSSENTLPWKERPENPGT
jgi:putative transposase